MDIDSPSENTVQEVANAGSLKDRSVQMIKNELVSCLENSMENLQKIWNEIGIADEQKEDRTQVVLKHLQSLLQEMVEEEELLKNTLLANVKTCTEELEKLSQELGVPYPQLDQSQTILRLENDLRTKVDELKMEKHERIKVLKVLRDTERQLCDRLRLPSHNIGDVVVPNKEQMRELEANIDYLQKQLQKRTDEFIRMKASIQGMWTSLEYRPQTALEKKMVEPNSESHFELSAVNLDALKVLQLELEQQQRANCETAAKLLDDCKSLWKKLEVDEEEQEAFTAKWKGFKPSTIAAMKDEKQRLQALKLQHMQKFIEGLREELVSFWDKCYYGEDQRNTFVPFFDTNFTEELLAIHEHQVEVMKGFFEENKHMFKMVEKRETMFKKMEELELKQNDVNRFSNRGGALLKECRSRRVLEKELPKLEKELRTEIAKWEEENEQQFMVHGTRYAELMEQQWENLKIQKEQVKQERHKRNEEIMKEELVFGSKPVTPKKRRFIGTTPTSRTPSKIRKGDTTATPGRLVSMCRSPRVGKIASICQSPKVGKGGRPPIGSSTKKKEVVSKRTPRRISARLRARRQVLGESSVLNISSKTGVRKAGNTSIVVGSKTTSKKDVSLMSVADYADFAGPLQQRMPIMRV
ncbi:protein regulator of cytokinesis 1 isoform X2 [Nematostella vectensis]|uniref:protein regulator of cytokinesis 1 isoform X2 n=1 Tax=Nematostella vectensis TaxID=45351 RepID=UPI002076E1F6|nr:protein regulator of cytokinesis 1 isoform X2 [Nematostella vectensis]